MDNTPIFCVFNLARRIYLSSRVTAADAVNQPLKVLKDLVALEAESGLWVTQLLSRPNLPRLFPYDLAYLDQDLRIVETLEVLPGVDFPAHRREVTSAVVLPPARLRTTQTRVGDQLLMGSKEEVDAHLSSLSEPITEQSGRDGTETSPEKRVTAGPADVPSSAKLEASEVAAPGTAPPGRSSSISQAAAPDPGFPRVSAAVAKSPTVSITEVVIEKPHAPQPQTQPSVEHRPGIEDLFANWVDSPAAPPSWIAQKAREHESGPHSIPVEPASEKLQKGEIQQTKPVLDRLPASNPEPASVQSGPAAAPVTPSSAPATQAPQRPQTNTFTIGQYGIWQLSTPTLGGAKRPASTGTPQISSRSPAGAKRLESAKADKPTPARRTGEVRTSLPSKPRQTPAPPTAPEKAPAPDTDRNTASASPEEARAADNSSGSAAGAKKLKVNAPPEIQPIEVPPRKVELVGTKVPAAPMVAQTDLPPSIVELKPERPASEVKLQAEKAVETAKAPKSDPDAVLRERFEKLQPSAIAAADSAPTLVPAARKAFAAKSQPAAKLNQASPTAPTAPFAEPDHKKDSQEQQHELAVTLRLPRFLKPKPEQKEQLKISIQRVGSNGKDGPQSKNGFGEKLKRWLKPAPSTKSDRRRAHRRYVPGMVAHYYTGGAPRPHEVADISITGFYLLTDDRWVPETLIRMTLQKPCAKGERKQSITVLSRIVRRGSDGVGAEFVMQESIDPNSRDILPSQATDRFSLARFL